jgi:two-component system, OmpR family, KDP operon response regulator KdpE
MRTATILVVDDEPQIRRVLRLGLSSQGYIALDAKSGEDALDQLRSLRPDVILLDIEMPGINGIETCRLIRENSDAAVIMLTVRKSEEDKIAALDAGADDFATKPFSMPELLARIRSNLRRIHLSRHDEQALAFDNVQINLATRRVTVSGEERRFTLKQFEVLRYLVTHPNMVIPHAKLLQAVWGADSQDHVQYLHVFIMQIRKKIEPDHARPRYILTEPWVGYRFNLPAHATSSGEATGPIAEPRVLRPAHTDRALAVAEETTELIPHFPRSTMGPKTAASVLAGARSSGTETPAEPEETGVVVQNSEVSLSVTLDAAKSLRDLIDRQIRILETRETRGENRETGSETRRRSKAKK